jgi:hypothetical protein
MTNYQVHPDSSYGVEIRSGESIDDYIAKARGFDSTAEWREYRSSSPERKAAMRRDRDQGNNSADDGDDIRRLTLEFLKASQ